LTQQRHTNGAILRNQEKLNVNAEEITGIPTVTTPTSASQCTGATDWMSPDCQFTASLKEVGDGGSGSMY